MGVYEYAENMKKQSTKKGLTIDDLAGMTQRGLESVHGEIKSVRGDVQALCKEMNERFDVVELKLIGAHDRRLDKIEDDMRTINCSSAKIASNVSKINPAMMLSSMLPSFLLQ